MHVITCVFCVFYFINSILSDVLDPEVQTPLGKVVGRIKYSFKGRPFKAFEGVPFAKPPVDSLRFEPPQPVEKWTNTLYAQAEPKLCVRRKFVTNPHDSTTVGVEDCLYLSVSVPVLNSNKLLPVLFYIHGGGFTRGNAKNSVKFIMDKDLIIVSINYRVSILGFLSTGDGHIPGNMGLKDQSMALKWTYDNIQSFGGDPKKITLIGCSTGAASVHFHYLSPLSRGLFQNGISFSGSALNPGRIATNSLQKFKKIAALLNCPEGSIAATVECLRYKPASELEGLTHHFNAWEGRPRILFGPVVEKDSPKPFIDRAPIDIMKSGDIADVLWVSGTVRDEGLSPGSQLIESDLYLQQLDQNWNEVAPQMLLFSIPNEYQNHFSEQIRQYYFGNERITKENTQKMVTLLGDRIHCARITKAAKLQAKVNTNVVLFWYFTHMPRTPSISYLMKDPKNTGVSHSDDINMILDNSRVYPPNDPNDQAVQEKMLEMLYTLAENGYPEFRGEVKWEKVDPETDELQMLQFGGHDNITMVTKDNFCNYKFWEPMDDIELLVVA